jgi:hypothetical protein
MSETLVRQWEMLRLIPRAPRKIATSRIEAILSEALRAPSATLPQGIPP